MNAIFYTVDDICGIFGWTRNTVYRKARSGALPGIHPPGAPHRWLFRIEVIDAICRGEYQDETENVEI